MAESMHERTIRRYWEAADRRNWDIFAGFLHEQVEYTLPQTRERVRGRTAFTEFNASFPGDWRIEVQSVTADDRTAVSKITFRCDGKEETGISFFEFDAGRIRRITEYWPAPYHPPVRASGSVERI
jgi:hypothetical protein